MSIKHPDIMTKPDPVKKEQAIAEALRQYRRCEVEVLSAPHLYAPLFSQWKGFAAGALAMLLVSILVISRFSPLPALVNEEEIAMLREMKQLFGNNLQAVIQNGSNIEPILSSTGSFTNSQPIIITLQQGDKTIRILSFSGNTVNVPLKNGNVSFSAYIGQDGKVLVEGENFLWSPEKSEGVVPAHLNAQALGTAL